MYKLHVGGQFSKRLSCDIVGFNIRKESKTHCALRYNKIQYSLKSENHFTP